MVTKKLGEAEKGKKKKAPSSSKTKTKIAAKTVVKPEKKAKIAAVKPKIAKVAKDKKVTAEVKVTAQVNEIKSSKVTSRENYWMTVLLYFASFLVGLGIVAEVAANWQNIPNVVKLGGALVAMLINTVAVWWTMKNDKPVLKQVFSCIYAFLIMGVIGLIGQVYHLHSHVANACLLWSLISWPLVLITPRLLWLWTPMFFFGARYVPYFFDEVVARDVLGSDVNVSSFKFNNAVLNILRSYLAFAFILAYELLVIFNKKQDKTIINPIRFYCGVFLFGMYSCASHVARFLPTIDAQQQMLMYFRFALPYAVLAGLIYYLNNRANRKSFMPLFLLGVLIQQAYVSLSVSYSSYSWWNWHDVDEALPIVFFGLMLGYARCYQMSKLFKLSILAIVFWFIGTFGEHIFDLFPSLMICAIICATAYHKRSRRWFNTGVIFAVIRILGYYADVDDLEHMGLYLIGSGVLIIATILFLMKYSKVLWEKKNEQ